jgi:hypothetical protein
MKNPAPAYTCRRGSALLTVTLIITVCALLSASILGYSLTERRGNERNRMQLRAQTVAENISLYAAEQLTTKLYRLGSTPVGYFPWSGTSTSVVHMPPNSVLVSEYNTAAAAANMEVRAAIEAAGAYTLVNDPASPNNGLQVATARVPIVSKGTASLPALGTVTAYIEQDMELALTPLFQFGMFYNMDLELYPSQDFVVTGPVHTNNSLLAHPDGSSTRTILFTDRVTAADYLIADHSLKARPRGASGAFNDPVAANGNVTFTDLTTAAQVSLKNGSNLWRDSRYTTTHYPPTATDLTNFKTWSNTTYNGNLRTGIHGVTKLQLPGIGNYKETNDPSTPEDDRNNGRQIIESPDHKRWNGSSFTATTDTAALKEIKISWRAGLYIMVNPDDVHRTGKLPDGTSITLLPYSYRCWLNTIAVDGTHTCLEVVLPGQPSYGYNNNGTTGNLADDFMYLNNLPNRFTNTTSVGLNQVLRIPSAGNAWDGFVTGERGAGNAVVDTNLPISTTGYAITGGTGTSFPADNAAAANTYAADAYFFDMRRANGNGAMANAGSAADFGRGTTAYAPRPIAKIDLDLARLKMMVARVTSGATTNTGYKLDLPTAAGTDWNRFVYNPAATPASFGLGIHDGVLVKPLGYDTPLLSFPVVGAVNRRDPFQLYVAPTTVAATPTGQVFPADQRTLAVTAAELSAAWYDGVAIYLHSLDAEQRSQTSGVNDRIDSGVRLWNGRGPAPTLTTSGKTGFTIATNDAIYVVGHFNADGTINSTTTSTGNGGYSAKYPDSANEMLCSVYGDAVTIVAQPTFARNGSSGSYTFDQTNGWADSKSAFPVVASSGGWRTSAAGNDDGLYNPGVTKPGVLPNLNTPSTSANATASNIKLTATDTEVSTALVVGIVPSNHNPTGLTDRGPSTGANNVNSGGANNFPRLLDDWSGDSLYIRGSMVALFESRVAMEPFTHSRVYRAPGRFWGLHYNFSQPAHDVPLEPIVLNATRVGFRRLSPGDYATRKAFIEGLTAIP